MDAAALGWSSSNERAIPRHYARADGPGLRCVGLRVFDQLEVHPLDLSAILAPEPIDPLPLAVGVAVVPVVPPVARYPGPGLKGFARIPVTLAVHLELPVALDTAPDYFALG